MHFLRILWGFTKRIYRDRKIFKNFLIYQIFFLLKNIAQVLLHILKTIEFESQQCLKKGVLELKPVCWTEYVPDAAARARRSGIYRAGSYRRAPAKPDTQSRNCPGPTSAAETSADIGLRRGMRCAEIFPFAFVVPPYRMLS